MTTDSPEVVTEWGWLLSHTHAQQGDDVTGNTIIFWRGCNSEGWLSSPYSNCVRISSWGHELNIQTCTPAFSLIKVSPTGSSPSYLSWQMPLDLPLLLLLLQIVSSWREQQKNSINTNTHIHRWLIFVFPSYLWYAKRLTFEYIPLFQLLCCRPLTQPPEKKEKHLFQETYFCMILMFVCSEMIIIVFDLCDCEDKLTVLVMSFLWGCILWIYSVHEHRLQREQSGSYSWVESLIVRENRRRMDVKRCREHLFYFRREGVEILIVNIINILPNRPSIN